MLNTQIEVFKTNVEKPSEAKRLLGELLQQFPQYRFNFDLDDCDKILRAEGINQQQEKLQIMELILNSGHRIEILADE